MVNDPKIIEEIREKIKNIDKKDEYCVLISEKTAKEILKIFNTGMYKQLGLDKQLNSFPMEIEGILVSVDCPPMGKKYDIYKFPKTDEEKEKYKEYHNNNEFENNHLNEWKELFKNNDLEKICMALVKSESQDFGIFDVICNLKELGE